MKKNVNRRGFFKLSYKEKQMVNNIMLKKEGKYTPFNLLFISIYIIMLVIFKENIIIYFFLLPLGYVVIRLRLYCYYNKHKEIDFDKGKNNYQEISDYTDKQFALEKFGLIVLGIVMFIFAIGMLGAFDNNDNGDNNYTEDKWCRTYTNAYRKCHYSYWEKRCVCKER